MKYKLLLPLALLLTAGCSTVAPVATVNGIVVCHHSKDESLDFSYDKDKVEVWQSKEYGVDLFKIETTSGKVVNLNSYEILNYTCEG